MRVKQGTSKSRSAGLLLVCHLRNFMDQCLVYSLPWSGAGPLTKVLIRTPQHLQPGPIPLTNSLAEDVKLPVLNRTVPESLGARFFRVRVWILSSPTPIILKGLFSKRVPSSHHWTLPLARRDSWQVNTACSPAKTSVLFIPDTMSTSASAETTDEQLIIEP